MVNTVDLLDKLAPNTWTGTGFNLIAVPNRGAGPTDPLFRLLLSATQETLEFSKVTTALDRGAKEPTVSLRTARYLQTVIDSKDGKTVIHQEPGLWVHLPPTQENMSDVFFRLALTPHGDCLLAQSTFFGATAAAPAIQPVNTFPFPAIPDINTDLTGLLDAQYIDPYLHSPLPAKGLPEGLDAAMAIKDPTEVLRAMIKRQTIIETDVIAISTKSATQSHRLGIVNIPFVTGNANAIQMDAIIWLETVKDGSSGQTFPQLQYVQRVILNFDEIHWPHVSVATLTLAKK
ncbi:MAG TPA: heme-binding protein [Terriglobia bacterium]|nr:heme-binding protein [Terriglobia bacterium]